MAATGLSWRTGTIARLRTKVGRYASWGMRGSSEMSGMTAAFASFMHQPEMQASIGNRLPFHKGEMAASSA
jgi:hypothetical protein